MGCPGSLGLGKTEAEGGGVIGAKTDWEALGTPWVLRGVADVLVGANSQGWSARL